MLLRTLNAVFDDKRIMVAIVWCWLIVVLCVFTEMVRDPHPTPKSEHLIDHIHPAMLLDVENKCALLSYIWHSGMCDSIR